MGRCCCVSDDGLPCSWLWARLSATILEPTDAVIQITHACICGTDLWLYRGQGPYTPGWQIGHEWMGIVMDVGPEVRTIKRGNRLSLPTTSVMVPVSSVRRVLIAHVGRMFSYNISVRGGLAPARAYLPELLEDVLAGRLDPSPILDFTVSLAEVASGYRAMDQRQAIKALVRP